MCPPLTDQNDVTMSDVTKHAVQRCKNRGPVLTENETRNEWQSLAYSPLGATVSSPSK